MEIGKAFSYPFQDKGWPVKYLIAAVLMIIPIIDFFTFGYIFNILKTSVKEDVYELPEWTDWGGLFGQGFFIFLLGLVYFIIPIVLCVIGAIFWAMGAQAAFYGSMGFGGLVALGSILYILGVVVSVIIAVFAPMGFSIYADTGDFGQALKIGEIYSLVGKNAGNYFITVAIAIGLGIATWIVMLILSLLLIIPVLGYIVYLIIAFYIMIYVYSVVFALFGSVYRGALAAVPPAAPPV